jgi:hypothetical protein
MSILKTKKNAALAVRVWTLALGALTLAGGAALLSSCDALRAMMGESLPGSEQTGGDPQKGGAQSVEGSDSLPPSLTTLAELEAALAESGPVIELDIGAKPEFDWAALLSAIETANKTVALDLSQTELAVTLKADGGGVFDPRNPAGGKPYNTGERYITKLILPDAATAIAEGKTGSGKKDSTFAGFTGLVEVYAGEVETINNYAFSNTTKLQTASFLAVTSIGRQAFGECLALTGLYLPADPPALPVEGGGTSRLFQIESLSNISGTLTIYVDGDADAVKDYIWEWEEVDEYMPATSTDVYGGGSGGHKAVKIVPLVK